MASWPSSVDSQERTRRLIDLFVVSVLLDAGAGARWQYKSKETGRVYRRSEGLAVASLEMFKSGMFSSDAREVCQVDSGGLRKLDVKILARSLQVTEHNPIDGLEGRASLLIKLADALQNQELFGLEGRPGNMLGMCSVLSFRLFCGFGPISLEFFRLSIKDVYVYVLWIKAKPPHSQTTSCPILRHRPPLYPSLRCRPCGTR